MLGRDIRDSCKEISKILSTGLLLSPDTIARAEAVAIKREDRAMPRKLFTLQKHFGNFGA